MNLHTLDGRSFEMLIVGYQFPHEHDAVYDSNWLRIQIDVAHPRGSWSSTDPSLLTYEVAALADWLDAIAGGRSGCKELEFTEPNLRFRVVEGPEGPTLRILFELESRPAWAAADGAYEDDLWLDLPLDHLDLPTAVRSLKEQLRPFPQRAAR